MSSRPAPLSAGPAGHLSRFLIYWGPAAINAFGLLCSPRGALLSAHLGLAMEPRAHEPTLQRAPRWLALGHLVTPALLGSLADKVGLRLAHLLVPGLVVVALICFVTAQALQRRTRLY